MRAAYYLSKGKRIKKAYEWVVFEWETEGMSNPIPKEEGRMRVGGRGTEDWREKNKEFCRDWILDLKDLCLNAVGWIGEGFVELMNGLWWMNGECHWHSLPPPPTTLTYPLLNTIPLAPFLISSNMGIFLIETTSHPHGAEG
jgi:hypothetical protein